MNKNFVITIGREYGSGGREVALKLAELLGVKCYDKDLLTLAAEKKGVPMEVLNKVDEKKGNIFGAKRASTLPAFDSFGMTNNDRVFMIQSQLIKELASEESCVIVGRCADAVLEGCDNVLSVFVTAPMESRIARITERYELSREDAQKNIARFDKERGAYYAFYTDKVWGDVNNYHLSVDSSVLGTDGTAEFIKVLADKKFNG